MAVGADTFVEDQSQIFVTQQDLPLPELLLHFTASHMDPYLPSTISLAQVVGGSSSLGNNEDSACASLTLRPHSGSFGSGWLKLDSVSISGGLPFEELH